MAESARKLERLATELASHPGSSQSMWVPGGLSARCCDGTDFPAEASLSRFEIRRKTFYTLILRNIHDRMEADRKIASLTSESEYLKAEIEELLNFREISGRSRPMMDLLEKIHRIVDAQSLLMQDQLALQAPFQGWLWERRPFQQRAETRVRVSFDPQ